MANDVVEISGFVISVGIDYGWRGEIHRCTIQDLKTGIETANLPCAGMELKPGDEITVTVKKTRKAIK